MFCIVVLCEIGSWFCGVVGLGLNCGGGDLTVSEVVRAAAKQRGSRSSQHFRAKANNRVDDLQGMVSELQQARREGRLKDVALLEEQMHQMLREWKAELREASPASSLLVGALPLS
jgi:hypothetical protein